MVFISYSRADVNAVRPMADRLERKGVNCWLDETNVPVGEAFVVQLSEALNRSDAFLLIDTPASRSSFWVKREKAAAFRLRRERGNFVVARSFLPGLADSKEPWEISVALTPFGEKSLAKSLRKKRTQHVANEVVTQVSGRKTVREGSFGQPQKWSGRQTELESLDDWWLSLKPGAWIHGEGGCGKSGLIQTWVAALEHLGYDCDEAVAIFFIHGKEITNPPKSNSHLADFVKRTTGMQHLVVLDGHDEASDSAFAEHLLNEALICGARILVSSRSSRPMSPPNAFARVELRSMPQRDGIAFLNQMGILGEDAFAVAEELENNPLALLVFSRHVAKGQMQPAKVLDLMNLMKRRLLRCGGPDDTPIGMVINEALRNVSATAQNLLSSLCRTDDLKWPKCLPTNIAVSDALVAVQELAATGLLQMDRLDEPTQLSIHNLVRHVVRRAERVKPRS